MNDHFRRPLVLSLFQPEHERTEAAKMTQMIMTETAHFEARMRQRGVRSEVVNAILDFGRCRRVGGADSYFMDKATRMRARDELGAKIYARIEPQLDLYVVASDDGSLLTVAHRLHRYRD